MAGIINGHDLLVYVGAVAVTHSTSCSITLNQGAFPITSKDSKHWTDNMPGARDWTVSTSGMVALDATYNIEELWGLVNSRASCTVKFATSVATDRFFSGTAYISSLAIEAPDEGPTTLTATFAGTGKLKFAKT
jgi:predicted secreted protein